MESLRLRTITAAFGIVLATIWVVPNVVNLENKWWFSKQKLNYGLDIQGGLHLVMGVDVAGVVGESTNRLSTQLTAELARDAIAVNSVKATQPAQGELTIEYGAGVAEKVNKFITDKYATSLQVITSNDTATVVRYYDAYMNDYKNRVLSQSIETIRNRIDEFGVAEPSISAQGTDRILIQLPGMADAEKAKQLINTTAKLDFMMVSNEKSPEEIQTLIAEAEKAGNYKLGDLKYSEYVAKLNEDLKGKLPEKTTVLFEKAENAESIEAGRIPYLVKTDTDLGGSALDDAFVAFNEYGTPEVSLVFNAVGANKFSELTGANIGKSMAIVLDKVVKSAPNIQSKIAGGRAVITLGGGRNQQKALEEAKMISTALRAGALPASLEQLEERRVGPTLGADSIKSAYLASLIGAIAIVLFMLARYKSTGIISVISLALNILFVFALLTSLGATLTLPGIAGIALTVGFAVDANVLINERMREELAKGSAFKAAVREGYDRAMTAIIDANLMSAATAVVLLYFGTGPVRGFAVTLLIGIVTTLFANVFVSKVLMDNLLYKLNVKKLSV
jgi:preprotein translocase subunit SecD